MEVRAGQVVVHAVEHGLGRPVLVLHGAGGDHREAETCCGPRSQAAELRRLHADLLRAPVADWLARGPALAGSPKGLLMSLDRLLGTWAFTMRHVALSEPVTGVQRYERVLQGAFLMLHWTYDRPEFPNAIAVLDERSYHSFDVRGVTRVFDLQVGDTGWTMLRRDADFWQRSSVWFRGRDAMDGTGENSYDRGATWQHDFAISYARTDPGDPVGLPGDG